jgi:hypothetical protein
LWNYQYTKWYINLTFFPLFFPTKLSQQQRNILKSGVPYITIHAQRKARAIWKLVQSIELTESLFLDNAAAAAAGSGDGANNNNNIGEEGLNNEEMDREDQAAAEDDVDSDDEMDDEGEELLVEGRIGSASLVSN